MVPPYIQHPNGDIFYNELADFVKGCLLTCGATNISVPVKTGTSPGKSAPIIFESSSEAYTEIFGLIVSKTYSGASSDLRVLITDTSNRRRLMSRPIPVDLVFGSNLHPGALDESLLLRPQQTLMLEFYNYDTGNAVSNMNLLFECRKFQQGALQSRKCAEYLIEQLDRKNYLYPYWVGPYDMLTDTIVLPGATGQKIVFFQVTNDIDLVILKTLAVFNGGDTTDDFVAEFQDAATSRPLQNQPVAKTDGFGNAQFPYVLPCAWNVQRNTKIQLNLTGVGNATQGFIAFQGVASFQGQVPAARL